MRGELDHDVQITARGRREYALHLSPELEDRFMAFFAAQTYHDTPADLLVVVVRNGLKVLEKRKAKAAKAR